MHITGFIGASGTGKSYHALVVAHERNIDCIIDDGLLIYQNRIIAGQSAKEESNRMQAVRRAIFLDPAHAEAVRKALGTIQPPRLLILGTSKHMICRICEALRLPYASEYIRIVDVSSAAEIAKARDIRLKEGKHIIPVPTMELKSHFHGYLLDPIRSFLSGRGGRKAGVEQSVVRPVFSYYGKLVFSDDVLFALVRHTLNGMTGIARVNRVKVAKNVDHLLRGKYPPAPAQGQRRGTAVCGIHYGNVRGCYENYHSWHCAPSLTGHRGHATIIYNCI